MSNEQKTVPVSPNSTRSSNAAIYLVDYKKTVCPQFKGGMCEKGKKCKYSHDLSLDDQRQQNIDYYSDPRSKIGKMPDTIITCKDFVSVVEQGLYGFNWVCPNGGEACPYRHMLP